MAITPVLSYQGWKALEPFMERHFQEKVAPETLLFLSNIHQEIATLKKLDRRYEEFQENPYKEWASAAARTALAVFFIFAAANFVMTLSGVGLVAAAASYLILARLNADIEGEESFALSPLQPLCSLRLLNTVRANQSAVVLSSLVIIKRVFNSPELDGFINSSSSEEIQKEVKAIRNQYKDLTYDRIR